MARAGQEIHSTAAGLGETSLFLSNPPSRPIYLCIALSRHYVVTHTCDFQSETHQDAVCGRALSDDTAASVASFFLSLHNKFFRCDRLSCMDDRINDVFSVRCVPILGF